MADDDMTLLHRTEHPDEILRDGFKSSNYPDLGGEGVCFGSTIETTLSGRGDWIVAIVIPRRLANRYVMTDETGPYSEMFFVPVDIANKPPRVKMSSPRLEKDDAYQRALEENRRRSEAMVNAQLTNPNPSR